MKVTIDKVREYWAGKNIPQQWYSNKEPFTLSWFNELSFKRYNTYYSHLKETMESKWHSGEKVLEVGCGIGTDLVEFAKNGAKVTGMDLSEDSVKLTKLNFKLRNLKYDEILLGDAESLPFEDASFDFVFSIGVIHHTPSIENAINEIYRVLKPDGTAIILVYAKGWKHYIKRCFIHGILRFKWIRYGFSWQKVYNEVSEVHGGSPQTGVYSKRQIKKIFKKFDHLEISKERLGEFFEYKPYNTIKFPKFVYNIFTLFNLVSFLGENWVVRLQKKGFPKKESLFKVLFKHY